MTNSFFSEAISECEKEGIPFSSWIDIELASQTSKPENNFKAHFARYSEWVKNGMHGEMKYLERGLERRGDPKLLLPSAESVFCVAIPYSRKSEYSLSPDRPRFARYISGPDYHEYLKIKLDRIFKNLSEKYSATFQKPLEWKVCVDTSAILERSWAALSGLGWIGKNTLLIHPKLGSYIFLGFVLTNQKSFEGPKLLPDYCGKCDRCIQRCPTNAIVEPHVVDSRSCISYLTLEKRGVLDPDTSPNPEKIGTWVAGCDICQEVCPFNLKPNKLDETWPNQPSTSLLSMTYLELKTLTESEYKTLTDGSALERIKFADFLRNVLRAEKNQLNSNP